MSCYQRIAKREGNGLKRRVLELFTATRKSEHTVSRETPCSLSKYFPTELLHRLVLGPLLFHTTSSQLACYIVYVTGVKDLYSYL